MKTVIITGATGGMGQVMSRELALAGHLVIMACKDNSENSIYKSLSVEFPSLIRYAYLDLASINSILDFAKKIDEEYPEIDILLNNAGVLSHRAGTTKEGFEITAGINYLGTVILTELLFPVLKRSKNARVVNMASLSYNWFNLKNNFLKPVPQKDFNRFLTYSNSKLALVYYTLDKAREWEHENVTINCADPGVVNTKIISMGNKVIDPLCDLFFRPIISTPEEGASTMLYLALSPKVEGKSGGFYKKKKKIVIPNKILSHPQREWLRSLTSDILSKYHIKSV